MLSKLSPLGGDNDSGSANHFRVVLLPKIENLNDLMHQKEGVYKRENVPLFVYNYSNEIMRNISYAEQISKAQVLISGLKANANQIARRGLDEAFVTRMDTSRSDATALNDEQERLKAALKMKTAELDAKLVELDLQAAEARKIVKMDFPQYQWKEFGIEDKR